VKVCLNKLELGTILEINLPFGSFSFFSPKKNDESKATRGPISFNLFIQINCRKEYQKSQGNITFIKDEFRAFDVL